LLLLASLFIPFGSRQSSFRDVRNSAGLIFPSNTEGITTDADFLIQDERLYLKFQESRPTLLFVRGKTIKWSPSKLQKLREAHPEVERYLPDPTKPDGGIPWFDKWVE